jgi:hypothetical protein
MMIYKEHVLKRLLESCWYVLLILTVQIVAFHVATLLVAITSRSSCGITAVQQHYTVRKVQSLLRSLCKCCRYCKLLLKVSYYK